jgi:sialate O-acetylesterase
MKLTTLFLIGFLLLFTGTCVYSEVILPRVIGSNMVLQRDMQAPIWGWASVGEEVTITLSAEAEEVEPVSTTTVIADAEGNWQIKLPAMAAGGPYTLRVKGSNTLQN